MTGQRGDNDGETRIPDPPDAAADSPGARFEEMFGMMMGFSNPGKVLEESMNLYQEMFKIAVGASEVAPDNGDRSWWEYWSEWTRTRSGAMKPAPATPGNAAYPAIEPAPGTYVHG